jgi:hypothetical protein
MRLALPLLALVTLALVPGEAAEGQQPTQGVLGPGLYVFQTRLDEATCEPDSMTGYVTSYFAAIDGTPGSTRMTMKLTNSEHWPEWELRVSADGTIRASARNGALEQSATMRPDGSRFTGRGFRTYDKMVRGQRRRCRNEYDALLRKLHD